MIFIEETKNKYIKMDGYYIGYTNRKHNEFLFDEKDYEIVSKYNWRLNSYGHPHDKDYKPVIYLVSLLFGNVPHVYINGNKADCKSSNVIELRNQNNKITYNGYYAIYMPEHHRAFDNGCVYEHILIAEKMLGRELKPEEVVHHIDRNRKNNLEDNLMVFISERDHVLFHAYGLCEKLSDGTYKAIVQDNVDFTYINMTKEDKETNNIKIKKIRKKLCPICNRNYKYIESEKCIECLNKNKSKNIPPKEILENYINKKIPFTQIGKEFGVTDNAVRKWCKKYNLPFRTSDIKKFA